MGQAAKLTALILDPDPGHRDELARILAGRQVETIAVTEPDAIPELLRAGQFQFLLCDLDPDSDTGLLLLRSVRSIDDDMFVICFSQRPTIHGAVAAMRWGAFEYLRKPVEPEELGSALDRAIRAHGLLADKLDQLPLLVGRHLRARRQELGLTLKQVAKRSGVSLSLISDVERGEGAATIRTLYKLSSALRTPLASLFDDI